MKRKIRMPLVVLLLAIGARAQTQPHGNVPAAQTSPQPETQDHGSMSHMEMHHPQDTTSNVADVQEPENPDQKTGLDLPVPDLLEAAKNVSPRTLDDFEALALKNNPTLKQAAALARVSAGLAHQAGLWPNPSVGYQGEQIRGGSFGGGEQGGFIQQNIVLGGKLRRRRDVFEQQHKADEFATEEQKLDVLGAVR